MITEHLGKEEGLRNFRERRVKSMSSPHPGNQPLRSFVRPIKSTLAVVTLFVTQNYQINNVVAGGGRLTKRQRYHRTCSISPSLSHTRTLSHSRTHALTHTLYASLRQRTPHNLTFNHLIFTHTRSLSDTPTHTLTPETVVKTEAKFAQLIPIVCQLIQAENKMFIV